MKAVCNMDSVFFSVRFSSDESLECIADVSGHAQLGLPFFYMYLLA